MIKGSKHSKETRNKIRMALIGRIRPKEVCDKISKSSIGKKGNCGSFKNGHKLSEKTKRKISIVKIGKSPWNKGFTKEMDFRLDFERPTTFKNGHSLGIRFGRDKDCSGENHSNWKGGISKESYGLEWTITLKESIRERDNYECQRCGISQEKLGQALAIHHIDWNKKNMNPQNLISLCRSCHTKIHRSSNTNWQMISQLAQ